MIQKGDVLEVSIQKLLYGGAGMGRIEGQVVFVDFSAPGDILKVTVTETKKNFVRGRILEILKAGEGRVKPPCPVFGRCGGCQWQHLSYSEQIKAKQNILREILVRFLPNEDLSILGPFVESPLPFNYRNRIQLRMEEGALGYYEKGTHRLVPIEECFIGDPFLNQEILRLKGTKRSDGRYRLEIQMEEGDDSTSNVAITNVDEEDEPLGFAQVNQRQNQTLIQLVESAYRGFKSAPIFDLYGGYGNLSLPLAQKNPHVTIEVIEWNKKAIEKGIENAARFSVANIKFIQSDVGAYLQRIRLPSNAVVLIDPPRDGCSSLVISELEPIPKFKI